MVEWHRCSSTIRDILTRLDLISNLWSEPRQDMFVQFLITETTYHAQATLSLEKVTVSEQVHLGLEVAAEPKRYAICPLQGWISTAKPVSLSTFAENILMQWRGHVLFKPELVVQSQEIRQKERVDSTWWQDELKQGERLNQGRRLRKKPEENGELWCERNNYLNKVTTQETQTRIWTYVVVCNEDKMRTWTKHDGLKKKNSGVWFI